MERTQRIKQGNPLDTKTMLGAQASNDQKEKILSYFEIGRQEGAKGPDRRQRSGSRLPELQGGYYIEPTVFEGSNSMRIFQEEIFGPVLSVTKFADEAEALQDRE